MKEIYSRPDVPLSRIINYTGGDEDITGQPDTEELEEPKAQYGGPSEAKEHLVN